MFRQAAASSLRAGEQQSKMFIKKMNKEGELYYVLNKRPESVKRPKESEYFQINDLLLDLDDMFSKDVRSAGEEDEVRALNKWSRNYKREELQKKLHNLEGTLDRIRLDAFRNRSNKSNSWRLGSHDIFSAALGVSSKGPLIVPSKGSAHVSAAETPTSTLQHLCSKTGIPFEAQGNDLLLLQWLKIRSQLSDLEESSTKPRSHTLEASAISKDEHSFTSLRRSISQFLSSDVSSSTNTILSNAPYLYETFGEQNPYNFLVFIGNLEQRLSAKGEHIGGPLCGFGLRLSATICNPSVTRKYLSMGFERGHFKNGDQELQNIHECLETYLRHFDTASLSRNLSLSDRQILLKVLVGDIDKENISLQQSVRSLILPYLQGKFAQGTMQTALSAYRAYIVLLGHLGARALLVHEKRSSATMIENSIRNEKHKNMGSRVEGIVTQALQTAIDVSVVAPTRDAIPTNLDLAGCTRLDLEAIEKQVHSLR
ncbi:hypothetical protein FHETE_5190 [Fusarium heterosporum]|uniref:Uncharacterized protein n=1 Tax=Fusarium heterosporum TaxID=42747 RepID=A0A8H5TG40_FUSHE|nr:hypothetical protein FHETE_5190 [Fusarium heterosporum]